MLPVLRSTWTGFAASSHQRFCIWSTRFTVNSPSSRRLQPRLYQARHPAMELVRPIKKQRTAAFVADADSPAVLSEETEAIQDPANVVGTGKEAPARCQLCILLFCLHSQSVIRGPRTPNSVAKTTLQHVFVQKIQSLTSPKAHTARSPSRRVRFVGMLCFACGQASDMDFF